MILLLNVFFDFIILLISIFLKWLRGDIFPELGLNVLNRNSLLASTVNLGNPLEHLLSLPDLTRLNEPSRRFRVKERAYRTEHLEHIPRKQKPKPVFGHHLEIECGSKPYKTL